MPPNPSTATSERRRQASRQLLNGGQITTWHASCTKARTGRGGTHEALSNRAAVARGTDGVAGGIPADCLPHSATPLQRQDGHRSSGSLLRRRLEDTSYSAQGFADCQNDLERTLW